MEIGAAGGKEAGMARRARKKIRDGLGMKFEGVSLGNGWTAEAASMLHGTIYHCYSRAAGLESDLPFTDEDKADLVRRLKQEARVFTVELVGWELMGNHYHVILFAPARVLTPEEAAERIERGSDGKKHAPVAGTEEWLLLSETLRDISAFSKAVLQKFAIRFNKNRKDKYGKPVKRHGPVFDDRFKSTIVDSSRYFIACLLYVILNRVRANLCQDPADSRYGMWGEWCRTGRCPLSELALDILRLHLGLPPSAPPEAVFDAMSKIVRLATETIRRKAGRLNTSGTPVLACPDARQAEIDASFEILSSGSLGKFWIRGIAVGSKNFINRIRRGDVEEPVSPAGSAAPASANPDSDDDPLLFHTFNRLRCRC